MRFDKRTKMMNDFVVRIRELIEQPPVVTTTFYIIQKKKLKVMSISKGKIMKLRDPEDWRIDDE